MKQVDLTLDDALDEEDEKSLPYMPHASNLKKLEWRTSYKDPNRFSTARKNEIYSLFNEISHQDNVSDVFLSPELPIILKVKSKGFFAITHRPLEYNEAVEMVKVITNNPNIMTPVSQGEPVSGLARLLDGDFIDVHNATDYIEYSFQRRSRYRYEVVGTAGIQNPFSFSMVMRPLPSIPPMYSEIGLPLEFVNQCIIPNGLVIVAGATGEGKTTTMASIIRYILENDTIIKGNIFTHEDPIEIPYDMVASSHSHVTQSNIGSHIKTFDKANSAAMRRSGNLILVGELRDDSSVDKAVELSLTGHPVFATTHASNVAAILPRLLSRFPKEMQTQKCFDIIMAARVFVAQKLIWRTDGKLMSVREVLPFSNELRAYLEKYAENPSVVIRKISGIMREDLMNAQSFKTQGQKLLNEGIISEDSYNHLIEKTKPIDDETLKRLESF